ncbi:MAG TPA: CYTH domain-containing protein, partial [Burkholderiaceae bacterium]
MTELELKFRLPPGARAALLKAVGNHGLATQSLAARYFDTPDALLARHRMALRLRAEDGRWVQTLKASLPDSMERLEDEVDVGPADAEPGPPDPSRHAAGEAGRRLLDLLERHPGSVLAEGFRTEVERRKRRLESHGATVEWALDEGRVVAGGRVHAIDELELELKGGDAAGLYAAARDWVARH